jgi:PHD/YefM family antitoxin component YafN of YafNO toxin-antitoxin module
MRIIPIKDLKNTGTISEMCHSANEPIFITKNGYGDMVIMSVQAYEEYCYAGYVRNKLAEAENDLQAGIRPVNARIALAELRAKYAE